MTSESSSQKTLDPNGSLGEILAIYPGAQRALFRKYHVGGCSSCGFSTDETLLQLCARNEQMKDVDEVISFLKSSQEEDQKMQIAPHELASKLKNAKGKAPEQSVRLLDIRTREEFEAVHIAGSELFSQEQMQEVLMHWHRETGLIVIVDHQGTRNLDAAAYFAGHGFQNVRALIGGIDAWSAEVDSNLPRYTVE